MSTWRVADYQYVDNQYADQLYVLHHFFKQYKKSSLEMLERHTNTPQIRIRTENVITLAPLPHNVILILAVAFNNIIGSHSPTNCALDAKVTRPGNAFQLYYVDMRRWWFIMS